jgi:predicted small metal-binding protein
MSERKVLRCGTIFPGCDYVVHGETDAEVLAKVTAHAKGAHEIDYVRDDLRSKIVAHIVAEKGKAG